MSTPESNDDNHRTASPAELEKLRLVNTEFKDRLDRQALAVTTIDTKGTTVLGFSIALGAFIVTQSDLSYWRLFPLLITAASCALAYSSLRVRKYKDAPDPSQALTTLMQDTETTEEDCLNVLIRGRSNVFVTNSDAIHCKALRWRQSAWTLSVAGLSTAAIVMIGNV